MRTVDTRSLYAIQPAEMSTSKGNQSTEIYTQMPS